MRSRMPVSVLWVSALLFGMVLGVSPRVLHAADVRGTGKGQGKIGDLCKTTSDCEQTPRALYCRESEGVSKCYAVPAHPVT